jgi:probable F420-dependent oxidoreductase
VLALAGAAVATERVQIGTGIAWAFARSPLLTAVTALDLDEMSGGRFVLGLGTGTRRMRTDWLGAAGERPARRVRETIEAIRAVWSAAGAGAVEYEGELVKLRVRPYGRAGQVRERIPIFLAAVNEGMLRTAGEVADGVVTHPMATARYLEEVVRPAIGGIEVADWLVVAPSDDPAQARQDAKRQIAFHATVRTYDRILELHGFDGPATEIRERWKSFDLQAMTDLVTDQMLEAMAVAGSPEECRDRVAERAASADRLLLGAPVVATDPDRVRDYHDAIVETFGG